MRQIHSQDDFEEMLRAEQAVVFVFFPWSKRAGVSRQIFEDWEREFASDLDARNVTLYEISPDSQPYSWKWLNAASESAEENQQANGTVIWSKNGSVAGGLHDAAAAGIKRLNHLTHYFFSSQKNGALDSGHAGVFDIELLKILCCPETRQKLQLAAPILLEKLNRQIADGRIRNQSGQLIQDPLDAGLVRADGRCLYPLRQNIPVLLVDEGIPLP